MAIDLEDLQKEVTFKTSRSSGAGGQNVNKVETKVTLVWNIRDSQLFSAEQKARIEDKLSNRIQADGFLQLSSSDSRSQLANKEDALAKLVDLLDKALLPTKKRIPTKIPRAKILERLDRKKKQSAKKSDRRWRME
ncbi:aminoacyl-tRNA hydrolase [Parapedobacter sp. SGR-10]|uniref:alternative ribosome rescue aminoacyl-tRNA hydrolase ArfB n=1 Tax=Parapedobacter sp. SGR-10 TaxID=2710879 RepID=UPI0013D393B7|nr:alternative ribosome rescue aminoacyl-tRNA hydrolase ArfB [Parapedobacter sp. SGR-10]NGF55090.1 aminoacyl-tRNA hydrolase [Parapedobacter sp. SGR-10]